MSLTKLLGIPSDKWDNPEESTGELVGQLRGGRYRCWEATGRARRAFDEISPEIKDYLEASSIPPSDTISWSVYMIGRTKETATPKILICSTDIKNRKQIRRLIKESRIITKYPGMGLGDVSVLPDRQTIRALSRQVIQALLPPGCNANGAVLIEVSKPPHLGKRLFVVNAEDFSLRPTTAGPVVVQGEKYYQLTVAHVFQQSQPDTPPDNGVPTDDCDFDGMSDDEEYGSLGSEIMKSGSATPEFLDSERGSFTARIDMMSSMEGSDVWFKSPRDGDPSIDQNSKSPTNNTATDSDSHGFETTNLRYFGSLALSSTDGNEPSLDYALIELATDIVEDLKMGTSTGKAPHLTNPSFIEGIGVLDTDVVATTCSRHLATGRLTATSCYVRLPGQISFQKLYPAHLDKPLVDGDCGSAIIGKEDGHFYGHIVAGGPGTCVALIVSADDISRDIEQRTGRRFALLPNSHCLGPNKGPKIVKDSLGTAANQSPIIQPPTHADIALTSLTSNICGNANKKAKSVNPTQTISSLRLPDLARANVHISRPSLTLGADPPIVASKLTASPDASSSAPALPGSSYEDWEREFNQDWLEEKETFPQYCMVCEKQFISADWSAAYCSDSCRQTDHIWASQPASSLSSNAPSSYPFQQLSVPYCRELGTQGHSPSCLALAAEFHASHLATDHADC